MKKMLSLSLALVAGAAMATAAVTPNNLEGANAVPQKVVSEKFVLSKDSKVANVSNVSSNARMKAAVKTFYSKPEGSFFMGIDPVASTGGFNVMYVAPFENQTWTNLTEGASDLNNSIWQIDPSDPDELPSICKDFTTTYFGAWYNEAFGAYAPTLTVDNVSFRLEMAGKSKNYPMLIQGGREAMYAADAQGNMANAKMATCNPGDPSVTGLTRVLNFSYDSNDAQLTADNKNFWSKITKVENTEVKSFITILDKPAAPYMLRSVSFTAVAHAEAGAEFVLNVYKRENGEKGELLATSKMVTEAEVSAPDGSGVPSFTIFPMEFPIAVEDPATGFTNDYLLVDSEIMCELTGFYGNAKVKHFSLFVQLNKYEQVVASKEYNSLLGLYDANGNMVEEFNASRLFFGAADPAPDTETVKQFCVLYDITMPFVGILDYFDPTVEPIQPIDVDMTAKEITYQAKGTDEVVQFETVCSETADNLFITDENGNDLPEWVKVQAADLEIKPNSGMFVQVMQFQIKGMPAGLDGRKAKVRIDSNNAVKYINIIQGTGSVNNVTVDGLNAVMAGEALELTYPAEVAGAQVFNVAGQLVKDVEFDGTGIAKVDAQDLAKGVYVVKFANNKTVKVIK